MRIPHHLRRGPSGLFHFRIVVPVRLRAALGRTEIKQSLNTRNPREATLLAYTYSARIMHAFQQSADAMNPDDIIKKAEDLRDMVLRLPGGIEVESASESKKDIQAAKEMALDLLKEQAVKDLGKFGTLHQPARQPMMTQVVLDPGLQPCKLSQAIEEHLLDLATRETKTKDLYTRGLLHFQAWLQVSTFADKNPYVHEINSDHVRKWKEQLKAEAVERAKKKRANNKHEQQKIADDPELAKVEPELKLRTADNYLTGLSTFLAEMQLQQRFPQNAKLPTEGQAFTSKSQRMRSGWKPFNETELAAIFDVTNYATLTKPHEYWFPLLALLTGARREEIAQLGPDDIRKESNGWIIDINDRDFRKVKTASGVRIIPLHPMLVTLGFLDYIQSVQAEQPKARRIFPYLRYDKGNGFGDVPGEAFARYLDRLGITGNDKVLHSMRKNANDRMQANNVDEAYRCRMVGHVHETVNATVYASQLTLAQVVEKVIPNLTFPELDLPKLMRPANQHREALVTEIAAAAKRRMQAKAKAEREARNATPPTAKG
jgi:integrase